MNISGVVLRARPEALSGLIQSLNRISGVQIHGTSNEGRMVITVESNDDIPASETILGVQNLEGVLSASMVYNYCDDHLCQKEGKG